MRKDAVHVLQEKWLENVYNSFFFLPEDQIKSTDSMQNDKK